MSRIRIVGGSITKTSKGGTTIEVLDGHFISYAAKQNIWDGGENGITYHDYVAPEKKVKTPLEILFSGWWSPDYEGRQNLERDSTSCKSTLEETVFFQLNVSNDIPVGTNITFQLWDKDTGMFIDWIVPDDDQLDGKKVYRNAIVREVNGKHRMTIELFLNPRWDSDLASDKGLFKNGCLDFYWTWKYKGTNWTSNNNLLSVYKTKRDLFISEAYPSKYKFPEIIDSSTGESLIFLLNEGSDAAGMIDSKIDPIYMIRVRVLSEYKFEGGTNSITKKMFEERYNLRTGESSSKNIFEVTESVAFKIKDSKTITNLESTVEKEVKKSLSDYFNMYDIGKLGIRGTQEVLNIFGYLDLIGDLQDAVAGRGLSTYDTVGLGITAGEKALEIAATQEAKLGIMTTKEIASMALPKWITPATWILIGVEETISKPFVAQVMQDIEETMFWRMEYAKRGGLEAVDLLLTLDSDVASYFMLIKGIPQQKHNDVFAGKVKTYAELEKDNAENLIINYAAKTYTYLLQKVKTDDAEVFDYNIVTIFL